MDFLMQSYIYISKMNRREFLEDRKKYMTNEYYTISPNVQLSIKNLTWKR